MYIPGRQRGLRVVELVSVYDDDDTIISEMITTMMMMTVPIEVTLVGILIDVSDVHPAKALQPEK